jgi:hypothetical protein
MTQSGHLVELSIEARGLGCPRLPCRWEERCIEPLIILAPIVVDTAGELAAATLDESPKNIIAAQIRDQGYKCDTLQSAIQDM